MTKSTLISSLTFLIFLNCSKSEIKNYEDEYKYVINQNDILTNKNLPQLLEKLENCNLVTKNNRLEIPEQILNFIEGISPDFKIANPNEKWNATDVILNKDLPPRKLIYYGECRNLALMSYNLGGIGKSTKILIFEFDNDKILNFWCGTILVDLEKKDEIIKYLKENINIENKLNTNILYL